MPKVHTYTSSQFLNQYKRLMDGYFAFQKANPAQNLVSNTNTHDLLHHGANPTIIHKPARLVPIIHNGQRTVVAKPQQSIFWPLPPSYIGETKANGYGYLHAEKSRTGKWPRFREFYQYMRDYGLNTPELRKANKTLAVSDTTLKVWYLQNLKTLKAWFAQPGYPTRRPRFYEQPVTTLADEIQITEGMSEFTYDLYRCPFPKQILEGKHMQAGQNLKKFRNKINPHAKHY